MAKRVSGWRGLAVLAALAGVAATAATVSQGTDEGQAAPEVRRTTITLAGWGDPPEVAALRRLIATFERRNRDIDVRHLHIPQGYDESMLARFAARRPPDVFYVDSLDVPDYLPGLEPLNDEIRRSKFPTRLFYPRLLNAFRVNGQIYGFPKDWSPLGMQINTRMMTAARIQAPRTWADLRTAARRLRTTNAVPGGAPICLSIDWARILPFVLQNRGAFLNRSKTRAVINSRAARDAVNFYLNLIRDGLARTPAQLGVGWCGEALGREKAAIVFEGNWIVGYMRDTHPNVRFRTYPYIRNRVRANMAFTVSYSIGRQSRNKAAAWRFLVYLVSKQGMTRWSRESGFLPSRRDLRAPAGRAVFLREAGHVHPWQFVKGFQRVIDLANSETEAVLAGRQSTDAALRKIQSEAQRAISRSR